MSAITPLIYDPSPGVTPGDGSIIRTDQQNAIANLLNGLGTSNYNLVQKVNKKTTTYSAVLTDFIITADATSAGFTVTLPDASATGIAKKIMAVKKIDTSANAVTIQTVSSQTFDGGATSMVLITPQETVVFQSDGSNWIILDHYLVPKLSGQEKFYNPAATFYYSIVTSAITSNWNLTIPLIVANDTLATLGLSQTFTATTTQINNLKLGGQLNANGQTILNTGTLTLPTATTTIAGLNVVQTWLQAQTFPASGVIIAGAGAGLGTLTYTNSASSVTLTLPSTATTLAGLAVVQTFTAATTFQNSTLLIGNPAATFAYTIVASAIAANRNLTLPLITGTDTLAVLGLAQTFSGAITSTGAGANRSLFINGSGINSTGIKIYPNDVTSGSTTVIEMIASRNDGSGIGEFSSTITLAHLRTDQQIASSGTILGRILFGGNNTDGTFANILHGASIQGESSGAFASSSNMPIDLVFYTGIAGINPFTNSAQVGTEYMRLTSGGLLSLVGTISKYNNIATAGLGVTAVYASFKGSSSAATQSNVINYTPPASTGKYRVSATVATTAGTNTGTITCTITYKDAAGIAKTILPPFKQTGSATFLTSCTGSSLNFQTDWDLYIDNSATSITVTFTVTGTVAYYASATLEQSS